MKGVQPKKKFGQNFLQNPHILQKIADAVDCTDAHLVEVGPGQGALTEYLANKDIKSLDCIELDPDMIEILKEKDFKNTTIHYGDILQWESPYDSYIAFGNIPYYITSPIIRRFLYDTKSPSHMVFLMQKEVAQKILAKDGKHSVISLFVALRCTKVWSVCKVAPGNFFPPPKVQSEVLAFEVDTDGNSEEARQVLKIIHAGFAEKRKKLVGNLAKGLRIEKEKVLQVFEKLGISENIRAEDLQIEDWKDIYWQINEFIL